MRVRDREPFTELLDLLSHLIGGDRQTGAQIEVYPPTDREPETRILLREFFDDGKGHSGAFSDRLTPIDPDLYRRVVQEGYVSGVLMPGYVSDSEFRVTPFGRAERWRLEEEKMKTVEGG
jgi:hypothetical protein